MFLLIKKKQLFFVLKMPKNLKSVPYRTLHFARLAIMIYVTFNNLRMSKKFRFGEKNSQHIFINPIPYRTIFFFEKNPKLLNKKSRSVSDSFCQSLANFFSKKNQKK